MTWFRDPIRNQGLCSAISEQEAIILFESSQRGCNVAIQLHHIIHNYTTRHTRTILTQHYTTLHTLHYTTPNTSLH